MGELCIGRPEERQVVSAALRNKHRRQGRGGTADIGNRAEEQAFCCTMQFKPAILRPPHPSALPHLPQLPLTRALLQWQGSYFYTATVNAILSQLPMSPDMDSSPDGKKHGLFQRRKRRDLERPPNVTKKQDNKY